MRRRRVLDARRHPRHGVGNHDGIEATRARLKRALGARVTRTYTQFEQTLVLLDEFRHAVAGRIKQSLDVGAFEDVPVSHVGLQSSLCGSLLQTAERLAGAGPG